MDWHGGDDGNAAVRGVDNRRKSMARLTSVLPSLPRFVRSEMAEFVEKGCWIDGVGKLTCKKKEQIIHLVVGLPLFGRSQDNNE